jgi:hypothetical protein
MDDWVIGSKDIAKYFGRPDWQRCKEWIARNGIPLLRLPNGAPAICISLTHDYLIEFNRKEGRIPPKPPQPSKSGTPRIANKV